MKKFYLKLKLVLLFVLVNITVFAQYTASNLEIDKQNSALAKDASGNIYTTRFQAAGLYEIVKYTNGTGTPAVIHQNIVGDAFNLPYGLAIASNGDIYFSSELNGADNGKITRLNASSAYAATVVQSGRYFTGLAFDSQDRLYALEYNDADGKYAIVRYSSPSTVSPSNVITTGATLHKNIASGSGMSYPTSVSVASNLTIYCNLPFDIDEFDGVDNGKGGILKLTTNDNGATYPSPTNLNTTNYTSAIFVDEFNNLYAIEAVASISAKYRLYKYLNGTGSPAQFHSADFASAYPYLGYGITAASNIVYAIDGDDGINSGSKLLKLTPVDVTPPAVPTGLQTLSFTGGSKVNLSWSSNSETDFNGYRIYGGTTNNPTTLVASIAKGTTTAQITGLTPGTLYYFVISSVDNNFNESAKSSAVSITPQKPVITSAAYNANNKSLTVTGTNFLALTGADNDIVSNKFTITAEGGTTRVLSATNVEITNTTTFSITLSTADQTALNALINKNGSSSTGNTTYNLAVATGWAAGEDVSVNTAQATIALTVTDVAAPTITSATYDGQTGALVVTGTNFYKINGTTNDIDVSKFTFTGENNLTYTLQSTPNVEITNSTTFTLNLSNADKTSLANFLNKNGTASVSNHAYNLAAADRWNAGSGEATSIADATNGITVSNYVNPVLPIQLVNFSHQINSNSIALNWSTSSEVNNKEFRLSRSANGTDFTSLANINGIGNSNTLQNYSFTDKSPLLGKSYYKLQQVDFDNIVKLERVIVANFKIGSEDVVIYPNPVTTVLKIQNQAKLYKKATLSDMNGKVLASFSLNNEVTSVNVDSFAKGVYLLTLSGKNGTAVKKVVKN